MTPLMLRNQILQMASSCMHVPQAFITKFKTDCSQVQAKHRHNHNNKMAKLQQL